MERPKLNCTGVGGDHSECLEHAFSRFRGYLVYNSVVDPFYIDNEQSFLVICLGNDYGLTCWIAYLSDNRDSCITRNSRVVTCSVETVHNYLEQYHYIPEIKTAFETIRDNRLKERTNLMSLLLNNVKKRLRVC